MFVERAGLEQRIRVVHAENDLEGDLNGIANISETKSWLTCCSVEGK